MCNFRSVRPYIHRNYKMCHISDRNCSCITQERTDVEHLQSEGRCQCARNYSTTKASARGALYRATGNGVKDEKGHERPQTLSSSEEVDCEVSILTIIMTSFGSVLLN